MATLGQPGDNCALETVQQVMLRQSDTDLHRGFAKLTLKIVKTRFLERRITFLRGFFPPHKNNHTSGVSNHTRALLMFFFLFFFICLNSNTTAERSAQVSGEVSACATHDQFTSAVGDMTEWKNVLVSVYSWPKCGQRRRRRRRRRRLLLNSTLN